jgi:hypothetical protein
MMELLVAILIALGSLTSDRDYTPDYRNSHQTEVSRAQTIIDNGQYRIEDGGVTVDTGIGT